MTSIEHMLPYGYDGWWKMQGYQINAYVIYDKIYTYIHRSSKLHIDYIWIYDYVPNFFFDVDAKRMEC